MPKKKSKSKKKSKRQDRAQRGENFANDLGTADVDLARAGIDNPGRRTGFLGGVVHNPWTFADQKRAALRNFWLADGEDFCAKWRALPQQKRCLMLQTAMPGTDAGMPLFRLVPELKPGRLWEDPDHLLTLYQQQICAETSGEDHDWSAIEFVQEAGFPSHNPPGEYRFYIVGSLKGSSERWAFMQKGRNASAAQFMQALQVPRQMGAVLDHQLMELVLSDNIPS